MSYGFHGVVFAKQYGLNLNIKRALSECSIKVHTYLTSVFIFVDYTKLSELETPGYKLFHANASIHLVLRTFATDLFKPLFIRI